MSLPTYLSMPILDWQPDWSDPSRVLKFTQVKNRLSAGGPGPLRDDAPHQLRPRTSGRLRYILESRDDMLAARDFLRDTTQGRRKSFWLPLWSQALHLSDPLADDSTSLVITRSGYTRLYAGEGRGREHLAFFPRVPGEAQTLVARKITDASEGDTTETLTLSSAVGYDVTLKDLVCFLLLCRLDTDSPILQWESFSSGILEVPFIDLPVQTP